LTQESVLQNNHQKISKKDRNVPSRKEREKQTRQHEILSSAKKLFLEKGYHRTTLEEIAQHAEFGKGTIYNYFSSKEELFFGILNSLAEEAHKIAESSINISGNVHDKFTSYAMGLISYAEVNSDIFQLIIQEMHNLNSSENDAKLRGLRKRYTNVIRLLAELITDEIKKKNVRKLDPLKLAKLFDSMVQFFCVNHFGPHKIDKVDNIDDEVALMVSVFFNGISEPKAKG